MNDSQTDNKTSRLEAISWRGVDQTLNSRKPALDKFKAFQVVVDQSF